MLIRLIVSLASLAVVIALVGPLPVSARMHFTTVRERLQTLNQRADAALGLTDPAAVQTQVREIITQAQAAKAASDEAAARPASGAEDRTVLTNVNQEMDGVVASANRALGASGADQRTALQDVKTRADRSLRALEERIRIQQAAPPASPGTLPTTGQAPPTLAPAAVLSLFGLLIAVVGLLVRVGVRRR